MRISDWSSDVCSSDLTGQRAQQERAIEIKRNAVGIMDVVAADEIGQLPDRNVAEVIERLPGVGVQYDQGEGRSEEHTSELQSLMRISYAVFCLKKKIKYRTFS